MVAQASACEAPSVRTGTKAALLISLGLAFGPLAAHAQGPANVLVVVNDNSSASRAIGDYYMRRREIPAANLCHLHTTPEQDIDRAFYDRDVAAPLARFLKKNGLV